MKGYIDIVKRVINAPETEWKPNRTGVRTKALSGDHFYHDMSDGFPLVTTKQTYFRGAAVETEFFIKGLTDKQWLKDRKCNIWNDWANPVGVQAILDEEAANGTEAAGVFRTPERTEQRRKEIQKEQNDLGKIYGYQWRNFNGVDQVQSVLDKLLTNPADRRMIVSAWNPAELEEMALPPCHLMFQVIVTGENLDTLNLNWYQRSVDLMLGLPFNIASYALLLKLFAKHADMKEGVLRGFLGDVHIYEDQMDTAKAQCEREPLSLPDLNIFKSPGHFDFLSWTHEDYELLNYEHQGKLNYPVAV